MYKQSLSYFMYMIVSYAFMSYWKYMLQNYIDLNDYTFIETKQMETLILHWSLPKISYLQIKAALHYVLRICKGFLN